MKAKTPTTSKVSSHKKKMANRSLVDPSHEHHLSSSLQTAFARRSFVDLTIVCGRDKVTFYAHRTVMAVNSEYFSERVNDAVVSLDDVEPKAFRALLHFIYYGRLEADKLADEGTNVAEVEQAAKKLGVKSFLEVVATAEETPNNGSTTSTRPEPEEEDVDDPPPAPVAAAPVRTVASPAPVAASPKVTPEAASASPPTKGHACKKCGNIFETMDRLVTHMFTHTASGSAGGRQRTGERKKECPVCKKLFLHSGRLIFHARKMHDIQNLDTRKAKVIVDGVEVDEQNQPIVASVQAEAADMKRELAEQETIAPESLLKENSSNAEEEEEEEEFLSDPEDSAAAAEEEEEEDGAVFQCSDCHKVFSSQESLKSHQEAQHLRKKYACDHCDEEFKTINRLNFHVRKRHGGGGKRL